LLSVDLLTATLTEHYLVNRVCFKRYRKELSVKRGWRRTAAKWRMKLLNFAKHSLLRLNEFII